jgi:hypothetical protein
MIRKKRKGTVFWYGCAAVCMLVILLAVTGCTSVTSQNPQNGGGAGVSSTGGYLQNTYFAYDCTAEYKATGQWGEAPYNNHGKFTLTGNIPFPLDYDYNNPTGYALYTDQYGGNSDKGNLVYIKSEWYECKKLDDKETSCTQHCHYLWDGTFYVGGTMVYNTSAESGRRWTVAFSETSKGDESDPFHTNSIQQTDSSCPDTDYESMPPADLWEPEDVCFNKGTNWDRMTPFTFSDSSAFKISPHLDADNYVFTSLDPGVTFYIGKAPS